MKTDYPLDRLDEGGWRGGDPSEQDLAAHDGIIDGVETTRHASPTPSPSHKSRDTARGSHDGGLLFIGQEWREERYRRRREGKKNLIFNRSVILSLLSVTCWK